ncbi:hypothetical protein [Nannocystis punicea]|uniref:Uncharacterized protein n=1 Tax=Nannocystis punicea TaxID=2995304 RepID=A0ABY7HFP2_9BACT|nr:hypothetical protein [Nannocystis poenicansa]WAS98113.1 hypothetical protein O0S08_18395 [Nannocystis poenicansa]
MSHRIRLSLIAALTSVMLPAVALADSAGSAGNVEALTVYESSSDNHAMFNGAVTIKERTGQKRDYKWGGSLCPGRDLSANSINLLFQALREKKQVEVTPTYKAGNGGERCLTGFKLENR